MKLRLPSLLLAALLQALPVAAVSASYLAEGVDRDDLAHSERFYDVGKGWYWTYTTDQPYKGARELYSQSRDYSFMGELEDRMTGTSFSTTAFSGLKDDGNTCGYQVPANQIQYWLSYYGVFYTGNEPLAYGFTYSRDNLEKLAGTQSLDVGMLFYDTLQNVGNNLRYVGYWYFYDRELIESLPYPPADGWFSSLRDPSTAGGFFSDYFTNPDEEIVFLNFIENSYSNSRPRTLKSFTHELVKGFGMEEAADGSYVTTRPGQLVYLGLSVEGADVGHSITCYGFDTDEDGMVKALHVVNSDDRLYSLFTLYVAKDASGNLALYDDAACTHRWVYSDDHYRWYISAMDYINTPEHLVDMYKLYSADDTPLTWTGRASGWSADYTRATTDELPSAETGWDIRIADQGFHAYYSDKRRLIFDDTAVSTEVAVSGAILTAEMNLSNSVKDYLFTGSGEARILPQSLVIDGTGASTFRGVALATDTLHCEAYTLRLAQGGRLTANAGDVVQHGMLELCGGQANVATLSFGKNATLRVSAASSFAGALTLQEGSVFDCCLSSANSSQALLSVNGSLTLAGTVKLEVEGSGLTEGASYLVCTVSSGSVDASRFFTEHGSLTFSDGELRLRYHELPSYSWSGGNCTWSSTSFGNRSCNTVHADVAFTAGSGTITLSGQVTPHHLSLSGGTYTFTGSGASIDCEGYVNLSGNASLTLKVPVSSQGILLDDRAKLTLESGAAGALSYISTAAGTTLNIHGAAAYLVEDAGTLAGQILVGSGTTLTFGLTHDAHLTGTVISASKESSLRFENRSTVRDEVVYELGYNLSGFTGNVTVGTEKSPRRATLSVGTPPASGVYTVTSGGALHIHGSGDFTTDVRGNGTVIVAEGAELAVPLTDGMPGFRNTLSLDVRGAMTVGSPQSTLECTLAQNLDVSGHMTVYMHGNTLANYDRMTLDGGSYTYVTGADPYDITTHIANLQVQAKGGTLYRRFEGATSLITFAGVVNIHELSGSGDLYLVGEHFVQMSYYGIDGVGASGYTGDLHVSTVGHHAPEFHDLTVLQLGGGVYGGAAVLECAEDGESTRVALGIAGDVSLRGLEGKDWGREYLYSGKLKNTNLNYVDASPKEMLELAPHTLTIDTAAGKAYHFYGSVLGPLDIVKKGAGTQSFRGDMSGFTGSATVQAGVLDIVQGLTLSSVSVSKGAELRVGGPLKMSGALSMTGGSLVAASSVSTAAASFSGVCTLQASSVTATALWEVLLTADNQEQSVLNLTSAGALNLKGLAVKYDKSALSPGSYKILTLSSANANALEGVTLTANGSAATLGSKGSATLYLQSNAAGQYDVMMDVAGAMTTAPTPSVSAASLVWQTSTGTWTVDTGTPTGVWAGNGSAANFRNGDDVTFSKAATVSVSGKVAPRSVTVNAASGTVTLKSAATGSAITGSTGVVKSGAGSLTISLANSYTGGTTIKGGTLTVGNASALGTGAVTLTAGTLNTGSYGVTNAVTAKGGTLRGTAYKGKLTIAGNVTHSGTVSGTELNLNSGTLHGDVSTRNVSVLNANGAALDGNLTLNGGTLKFGKSPLSVSGVLTLSSGTTLGLTSYTATGSYTLISAGSVSGSTEMLVYNHEVGNMGYEVSVADNALVLVVSQLSKSLTWAGAKGVWTSRSLIGGSTFEAGDTVIFRTPAAVTISGQVAPGAIVVNCNLKDKVTFTADKKTPGSGIVGTGSVTKSGTGTLTMNAGNTYSGGTVLNNGTLKATAADSFGTGTITLKGGTLDLSGKPVSNDIVLAGEVTLKGDAKYMGSVTVEGDATLLAKSSFKGTTTIAAGNSLTLAEKAPMAGSFVLTGGSLRITAPAGMALAKESTMLLRSGTVYGLLTVGTGSTLQWEEGGFTKAPILKGGTLDLLGHSTLTLSGSKAGVQFGTKSVNLPGKGIVRTNDALCVTLGTVTVSALTDYTQEMIVAGGTLKLATGKIESNNDIRVTGTAAVVNGGLHSGNISVTGQLAKGTNIKLIDPDQKVTLSGAGSLVGSISGCGIVNVNASINATAAKITASRINLYSGTYTNTAGITLAKGQTLALVGAKINLGSGKALTTTAGSTLAIAAATTLTGNLTLGGGDLVFAGGNLTVKGALTLSKPVTVSGTGSITYTTLNPYKGTLSELFGGAKVVKSGSKLTITGTEPVSLTISELATAPEPETLSPDTLGSAPADTAFAPLPAADPVADAVVQANWGILDAERAFMGAVNNRYQHAALLDKGQGAAWVSAFGSSVRHGSKGPHHGADGNIEGAAFGLEHAVSETASVGLAVGRSKNRIAATGVTHLRQETAHVALYGQQQLAHGFTADAAASYGDTTTKLGSASWAQKSAALSARLTHAQQLTDTTAFRTFGGLTYEATDSASVGSGSVQNLRAELGAGVTHTAGKAHLYAEAALTGDIVRHNPTVDFGGIRLRGANPGRIGIRATVGGLYEFTDTWSGTASYSMETESRSTSHTLNVGLSKTF